MRGAAFHAHDDALGIDRIDHAGALAEHHGARIAGGHALHAGAHIGGVGAQQRHGLALHVGTHQRTVGVVVLEERNQAGRHRDELLRADVDVLDFVAVLEHVIARLAGVAEVGDDAAGLADLTFGWATVYLSSSQAERYSQCASNSAGCFLAPRAALVFSMSARRTMSPTLYCVSPGLRILISSTTTPFSTLR